MKLKSLFRSLLQIFIAFLFMFGIFPYIAIHLNNIYSLPIFDYVYLKIIGLIFAGIGLAIVIHCAYILFFRSNQNIPAPSQPPEKLIMAGLYKYIRNPMYIGDFIIILSESLLFGHILILVYLLIAILFVNILVIFKEEKGLENKFGNEYSEYKEKVPRWFPHFNLKN